MKNPLEQTIEIVTASLQSSQTVAAFSVLTNNSYRAEVLKSINEIYETLVKLNAMEVQRQSQTGEGKSTSIKYR